jgi:hypothetical protein
MARQTALAILALASAILALGIGQPCFGQSPTKPQFGLPNNPQPPIRPPIPPSLGYVVWAMSAGCCTSASTPMLIQSGEGASIPISFQSINGFAGQISISTTVITNLPNSVTISFPTTSFYLQPNATVNIPMYISTTNQAFGAGSVQILATTPAGGVLSHGEVIQFLVNAPSGSVSMSATPITYLFIPVPVQRIETLHGPRSVFLNTANSTITLQSTHDYSGTLNLSATCCTDYLTGTSVTQPDGATFSFESASVALAPDRTATATATVHIALLPGQPSFGKFIATVQAALTGVNSLSFPTFSTPLAFTVVPRNETVPPCPLFTNASPPWDALRLGMTPQNGVPIVQVVINNHIPFVPDTPAAVYLGFPLFKQAYNKNTAMEWIINSGPAVAANTAQIVVNNQSKTDVIFQAYNSANCDYVLGKNMSVVPGASGSMTITKSVTTTLLMKKVFSGAFHNLGVFSEPAFWTVFSGRQMTFNVLGD